MVQLVQDRRSRQTADEDITPALVIAMVMAMAKVVAILMVMVIVMVLWCDVNEKQC